MHENPDGTKWNRSQPEKDYVGDDSSVGWRQDDRFFLINISVERVAIS